MPDIQRNTYVESRLESYKGFFDRHWKHELLALAKGTKIQGIAFDLARNWEAASNARALPWVLIKCLEVAEHCAIDDFEPMEFRKIQILASKLVSKMESRGEKMQPMFRKKLQDAVNEIDQEFTEALRQLKNDTHESRENHWDVLLGEESFHSSVWGSERTCYGSIYYGYEWFLKECVRLKRGEAEYRVGREFKGDFKDAFGETLAALCWTDQQVNIARLARSVLVHNGGRITEKLSRQPHPFRIEEGELQISATVTTELFHLLKDKVLELTRAVADEPEFR